MNCRKSPPPFLFNINSRKSPPPFLYKRKGSTLNVKTRKVKPPPHNIHKSDLITSACLTPFPPKLKPPDSGPQRPQFLL
uniref:Candidate secreted effector n=1 Tax=Meloidogyne incognita TaxID=6306 RepID=A0A914KUR6_MELIC